MGGGLVGGHGSAAVAAFVRESKPAGTTLALKLPSSGVHMGGGRRWLFFGAVFLLGGFRFVAAYPHWCWEVVYRYQPDVFRWVVAVPTGIGL